jgi:hypothetical protein
MLCEGEGWDKVSGSLLARHPHPVVVVPVFVAIPVPITTQAVPPAGIVALIHPASSRSRQQRRVLWYVAGGCSPCCSSPVLCLIVILVLSSPSYDRGVGLVVPLRPLSMWFVLAVSPVTIVVRRHVTNSPRPPCEQGLATAGVGTVGVGTRRGCCFKKRCGQRGVWVGGAYLAGTSLDEPSSGLPAVVSACCRHSSTSESLTSVRRGGDAYFGRPSWVGTK